MVVVCGVGRVIFEDFRWSRRDQPENVRPEAGWRPAHNFSRYVGGKSGECGEDTGQLGAARCPMGAL